MMKTKTVAVLMLLLTMVFFISCDEESTPQMSGKSTLLVKLTDSPGDYDAVYVDIQEIKINAVSEMDSGWVTLDNINTGMYDLLTLTNGVDTLLGENTITSGKVTQIRMILGDRNYVVMGEDSIQLKTPSAMQSGLKIQVNEAFESDLTYEILLDFDAAKSVVKAGSSGKYNLKPVIRAIINQSTGTIKGIISPDSVKYAVYAILGEDSIGTFTNDEGGFMIKGLDPNTYSLFIDASDMSGLKDTLLNSISVNTGMVTAIDTVKMELIED